MSVALGLLQELALARLQSLPLRLLRGLALAPMALALILMTQVASTHWTETAGRHRQAAVR